MSAQTTPPSSPLDTLKATALKSIDMLECAIDRLGGAIEPVPEELIDFIDGIRLLQYRALAEHMDVGVDERLGELRHLPQEAYVYDDGTPVKEIFVAKYGQSHFYPRYEGGRAEALKRHIEWTSEQERRVNTDIQFEGMMRDAGLGPDDPTEDL